MGRRPRHHRPRHVAEDAPCAADCLIHLHHPVVEVTVVEFPPLEGREWGQGRRFGDLVRDGQDRRPRPGTGRRGGATPWRSGAGSARPNRRRLERWVTSTAMPAARNHSSRGAEKSGLSGGQRETSCFFEPPVQYGGANSRDAMSSLGRPPHTLLLGHARVGDLIVSDGWGPFRAQAGGLGFQHHGMSSSMRSWGQPFTRRVSSSVM